MPPGRRAALGLLPLLLAAALSLACCTAATAPSAHALDVVSIVPSRYVGVASTVNASSPWNPVLIGNAVIDGNVWGLGDYRGLFSGYLTVYTDASGYLRFESRLDASLLRLEPWRVVGYPEVYYGVKPWIPGVVPSMSEHLELPAELPRMPRVLALVGYAVLDSSVAYNLAFDLWILRGPAAREPRGGDVELMIWLHRWGPEAPPSPAGTMVTDVRAQVLLDGELAEAPFDVWVQAMTPGGWTYVAFVMRDSRPRGEVGLDLTFFLEKTFELLGLSQAGYYVFSIELGFELFYGPRVDFSAVVNRFSLVVSEWGGVEVLRTLSGRSGQLIAWITPWGYPVDVEGFSRDFVPGVVIAYDVECGLCTPTLRAWLERSLRYVEGFRMRGDVVFVNLFPERYHPSWRWRGELLTVALNEEVLVRLKGVVGDGEGVYVGFSELTACVNNSECLGRLVEAYRVLRRELPAARLYYYGSGGDSVKALALLYREASLDLVGIDLWSYEYREGRVYIARYLVEKLRELSRLVPAGSLIVGEVGFRLNDREAYVEPWRKDRPLAYDEEADARYYRQVIEHLAELGLRPAYLGIWAWNDEVFAIQEDPGVQRAIVEAALETGLLSGALRGGETKGPGAPQPGDAKLLLAASSVLALAVVLLVLGVARRRGVRAREASS